MRRSRAPSQVKRARTTTTTTTVAKKKPYMPRSYLPRSLVSVGHQAFPLKLKNDLTYADKIDIGLGATGRGYGLISVNSLYDPDQINVGHQPLYFDQLMAIYDHYTVVSSRIEVTIQYTSVTTGTIPWGIYIDDDTSTTGASGVSSCMERPGCVYAVSLPLAAGTGRMLTHSWDAVRAFGPNPLANDNLQGNSSASPTEQQFFVIWADGGVNWNSGQITVLVKVVYTVIFDELATIAQS